MPAKIEDPVTSGVAPAATPSDRSIGDVINSSTRTLHTALNKLIIGRLRLALPPQANDCSPYVHGMIHISSIYVAFESAWETVLDSDPVSSTTTLTPRMRAILSDLHMEKLARAGALKADLRVMTRWSQAKVAEIISETAARVPVLDDFVSHINRTVAAKPHVLVAYAWVLYMALFAGGRYIRGSFERIDPASEFWYAIEAVQSLSDDEDGDEEDELAHEADVGGSRRAMPGSFPAPAKQRTLDTPPLDFFRFATPEDGADLKKEFKAKLAGAQFEYVEREDIVAEAQEIFKRMIAVVGCIDEALGTADEGKDGANAAAGMV
ncbi:heme oxygenase-like protein [Hypomontagnella monticulosa]|nr:heme oxygenase-like protein [Hypomontagnella monticulosa]